MNFIKKLAGETVIYGLGSVLPKILNFLILAPYLTRIFATDAYGIHGIIYGFAGLMIVFTTFRMETSFFRFASKNQHSIGETYSTGFIGVLIVSVLWFFIMISFSDTISNWLNIPGNAIYIKYFAWIVLFDALSALSFARLRMENKAKKFAWIKIINVLVNVIVIIFFLEVCPYLYQNKPESINWFYDQTKELDYVFIANLVASFFVFLLLLPILIKAKIVFNKPLFWKMLKYALPLIVVGVASVVNGMSDRFFITELMPGSVEENLEYSGIYNGCLKIAVLMSLFTTAFNYAAEPFFFKQAGSQYRDIAYSKIALAFSVVSSLIFLVVMLYLDILKYLIASNYWIGLEVVPILLMAYLFLGLFYNFSIWYKITDKTYVGAIIAGIGSLIVIGLNYLLIPMIGFVGAAWAVFICYLFMTIAAYITGQKYHKIPYPIRRILLNILVVIGLYFIGNYFATCIDHTFVLFVIHTMLVGLFVIFVYMYQWKFIVNEKVELI